MANSKPNTNPTPKQRFMVSPDNISKHRDLVDSQVFQRAEDYATMEFQRILDRGTSMENAAGQALMAKGASLYKNVFRLLSEEVDIVLPRQTSPNLDHAQS